MSPITPVSTRKTAPSLALGTAQFGLDYGVANASGRIADIDLVLNLARTARIDLLDTAPAYGDAESRLGESARDFRVITKTGTRDDPKDLLSTLRASLERLRRTKVEALLVHDRSVLLGTDGDAWFDALLAARDAGLTGSIGVSVYQPSEAELLLERYPLELVQLPINVFDQRAVQSGFLAAARARGVAVHARSVFLQGLLLAAPDAVPDELAAARRPLAAFRARAAALGLSPLEAALGHVLCRDDVDAIVIGVDGATHLEQILRATESASRVHPNDFADCAIDDPLLIDPSRWRVSR